MSRKVVLIIVLIVLLATMPPLVFAAKFNLGDTVEVFNTGASGLVVRDAPAGNAIGKKYDGNRGMVLAGPQSASLGGVVYAWWKVRWGDGALEGWSAEGYPGGVDYLKKVTVSPSTKFSVGNLVKVSTGGPTLIVRTDPPPSSDLSYEGSVADGTVGKIVGGPFYGVAQGVSGFYHFWKVDFLSIQGWSAEDWLTNIGGPTITSSLVLAQSPPYYVGNTITARFTITNRATTPFTFDVLTVGGRDPDNQVADFSWIRSITLSISASYNYQGTLTLTKVGNYHFFCTYRTLWGDWNPNISTEGGATNTLDIYVNPTPPPPNQPPYTPSNPSPSNHATGVSIYVDLSWSGGDPDVGDTVTYDVYFGTSTPPPLVSNDQSATTYDLGTLNYGTTYYWKIVATDNHGATTEGPIWDFTTQSAPPLLKITNIDPHEPIVSPYKSIKQYLAIHGEGFVPDSYVNFSDGQKPYRIPRERIRFIDSNNIEVVAGLGTNEGSWQVWITNPDGSQSNKFSFQTQTLPPEYGMKVFELAHQYWEDENTALLMTTIAYLESGWHPNAAGDLVEDGYDPNINSIGACSWGLWQIFMPAHIEDLKKLTHAENYDEIAKWLRDPNNNAKAARMVWEKQGPTAWTTYPEAIEKKKEVAELLGIKRMSSFKCPVNVTISDEYGRIISEVENQIPGASFEYLNATDTKIFYLPLNLTYHVQINATAYGNITISQITPTESVYEIAFSQLTFDLTSETVAVFDLLPYDANYTLRVDENSDGVMDYELIPEVETLTTEYDIGIVEIVPSETIISQGYNLPINVTIVNTGAHVETFNVTLYANETIIIAKAVTLANGTPLTITVIWDTSSFAHGNYIIKGYANPLPSETNTADNTYTDGTVQVLQAYTLTIITTIGGTTDPAPGTYSYIVNSIVQVTAIPDANYIFDHWELDTINVGSANPYTVLMDNNHTLKAVFTYLPPPPSLSASISPLSASILVGQSVTFTSTVSGGYTPYTYQWYLNSAPVSSATSNTWTFTPTTGGIYYVYLKVTDGEGNTAQSDAARITVATVPVGGYSIPIQGQATAKPLAPYLILTAIISIAFTAIKRKTTRKTKQ